MKIEIYKDDNGEWRWRLKARNGRIVADSGEGYRRKIDVQKILDHINLCMVEGEVEFVEE